ncbi:MAG: CapA family protein, partial [Myxococcota bacterium]
MRALSGISVISLVALAVGCSHPQEFSAQLELVDENGAPVVGAAVDLGVLGGSDDSQSSSTTDERPSTVLVSGEDGRVTVELDGPVLAMVSADGMLSEPVIIGRADRGQIVRVRMLSDRGGTRWVMHTGGDVMFGRRFRDGPTPGQDSDQPLIPDSDAATGAERVVRHIARAFSAADLRTVNLESVISDAAEPATYPAKPFVWTSRTESVAGLLALGVDIAVLANDHIRDVPNGGIDDTQAALAASGIAHVGAYIRDPRLDNSPTSRAIVDRGGVQVAVLAWTTVTGGDINDAYPRSGVPLPEGGDPPSWQLEARQWGYSNPDLAIDIPSDGYWIGDAWQLFVAAEAELDSEPLAVADLWNSLVAVYPEMQDWAAQRGHGGAALWDSEASPVAIQFEASSSDLVIVQLHGGYAYEQAPSHRIREAARQAIDAGAGLVVVHHPQVLQGAEWYRDRLIVYGLGNLVSDRDIFATFSSAFLRTVWDGAELVEARFVPFELVGYRPVPVSDDIAMRIALTLWSRSELRASSSRYPDGEARAVLLDDGGSGSSSQTQPARVVTRQHSAVILSPSDEVNADGDTDVPAEVIEQLSFTVPVGEVVPLDYSGLVVPRLDEPDVYVGRDLLRWGDFEDALADGQITRAVHWNVNSDSEEVLGDSGAGQGLIY